MASLLNLVRSTKSGNDWSCTIRLFDDSHTLQHDLSKTAVGQVLLDFVCEKLNLIEKDYFGLRFMDSNKHRYWLDVTKPLVRQIKGVSPIVLSFRVKFFPADPDVVQEEITRYYITLQLRRDLLHGRLFCPQQEAAFLGAYVLQSELGDFNPEVYQGNYVSQYKLMLKQSETLESEIANVHRTLRGMSAADAEQNFLRRANNLDTYGFDPYTVKEVLSGATVYVGATHLGVLVYQLNRKLYHVTWDDMDKVDYVGKLLIITAKKDVTVESAKEEESIPADTSNTTATLNDTNATTTAVPPKPGPASTQKLEFRCPSSVFCKHLWKHILEQRAFFTAPKATDVKMQTSKRRLFKRSSTFRCHIPRVLNEIRNVDLPKRATEEAETVEFRKPALEQQPSREERELAAAANKVAESLINQSRSALNLATQFAGYDSDGASGPPSPSSQSEGGDVGSIGAISNTASYDSGIFDVTTQESARPIGVHGSHSFHVEQVNAADAASIQSRRAVASYWAATLLRYLLGTMLFLIIATSILVVLMESRDRNGSRYVDDVPVLSTIRVEIYEPSRAYVLQKYQLAGGKFGFAPAAPLSSGGAKTAKGWF